ncbi:hypothetical protein ACF082_35245 [Streptomyces lydicus]|uniref:hypothetical protein n=1 Tax=Streptomyces lydicus TaxID=47763 RepID=UPI0036FE4491
MAVQAGDGVLEVVDGGHDVTGVQRVRRRGVGLGGAGLGRVELRQFVAAVAGWDLQHRNVLPDVVEPGDALRPPSLGLRGALQLLLSSAKSARAVSRSSTAIRALSLR